jgi:transcriptional regulator with XRE-family HTH domain
MRVAERIREHRMALRLSQAQLSRLSGVSRFKLNVFEAGGTPLNSGELERVEGTLASQSMKARDRILRFETLAGPKEVVR